AAHRAPWFRASVRKIDWCSEVVFEHRVVSQFGRGRCWVPGDAAHQTGPVGVHSMNMGFVEGEKLATLIGEILHDKASTETLQAYDNDQQNVWKQLLGLTGGLQPRAGADPWLSDQRSRILSCLPGLGADLASLAGQLGFERPTQTTP